MGDRKASAAFRPFIVAIDGPAGAGKSSASRLLAGRLAFALVDTGALYRAVALAAARKGIAFDDGPALGILLATLRIRLEPTPEGSSNQRLFLGDEDVSSEIRAPAMSLGASAVSALSVVREGLLELQRRLATAPGKRGAVLEGRDIGTVVFPDADIKFFLTASAQVRARRRFEELVAKGEAVTPEGVLAEQERRDRNDSQRAIAPLTPAADALLIDTGDLSLEAVVDVLAATVQARMKATGRCP
ncbi:MAG TPA: (d)CMP kinase [Anaeromyxobacteraceae bacterium]|nr:(d)CMP kinase [Anaeromyxobacteraceae bacterium]